MWDKTMDKQTLREEISVKELKEWLDTGQDVVVLDVREAHEVRICSLSNTFHIPLGELSDRLSELDGVKSRDLVVYCRTGRRSEAACEFLRENGFANACNLTGGIHAWSDEIDPSLKKY